MYIDTHTHLMDKRFDSERDSILNSLNADQIKYIISVGYDAKSSEQSYDYAKEYQCVFGAASIHPHDSRLCTQKDLLLFEKLCQDPKMVAIGEAGLDYHYDYSPRDVQRRVFIEHMELAHQLKLPIIIHLRDAYSDMLNILSEHRRLIEYGGVLHCYSGSADMAKRYLDLGLYISFAGAVTFKNAGPLLDAVKVVPKERILTETDCPYITPHPHRGKLNYPKYVKYAAQKVAEIKNMEVDELNIQIDKNCKTLFKRIT